MSSFIIHLLIPVLIVAGIGIVRHRDAWVWSWAAWAGDADYLGWIAHVKWGVPNVHRALFHNVWLLLLAASLAVVVGRKWLASNGGAWPDFVKAKPGWVLVPFMYSTHLVLDLFQGGISAFWPLSPRNFFWWFALDVDTTNPIPVPQVYSQAGTQADVVSVSEIYTWMTSEEFALIILYLLGLGLFLSYERAKRQFPPSLEFRTPAARADASARPRRQRPRPRAPSRL